MNRPFSSINMPLLASALSAALLCATPSMFAGYDSAWSFPFYYQLKYEGETAREEHLKDLLSVIALDVADYVSETINIASIGSSSTKTIRNSALLAFATKMAKATNGFRLMVDGHNTTLFTGPAIKSLTGPIIDGYLALNFDLEKAISAVDIAVFNGTREITRKEKQRACAEMVLGAFLTLVPSVVYATDIYKHGKNG